MMQTNSSIDNGDRQNNNSGNSTKGLKRYRVSSPVSFNDGDDPSTSHQQQQHNGNKKHAKIDSWDENQAIPFVKLDTETKKYVVCEESKTFLRTLKGPLGVIAVAGKYRTGKSYLMNQLVKWTGFGVGHTVQACTTGLMISPKTLTCKRPGTNETFEAIVMDTEGLFSLEADETKDTRVFALSLLLSTMFVYNSVGSIDKQALSNLALVSNISKWIRVQSNSNGGNENNGKMAAVQETLGDYFPNFLWVVRDFSLQLSASSSSSTSTPTSSFATHYLENALKQSSASSLSSVEHNGKENTAPEPSIGDTIVECFPKRDCLTMVRPANEDTDLQRLEHLNEHNLKPMFVKQVQELRTYLCHHTQPKTAFGKSISGDTLVRLAELFCKSINEGSSPVIRDTWSMLSDTHNTSTVEECLKTWQQKRQETMQLIFSKTQLDWVLPESLRNMTQEWNRCAGELFLSRCFGECQGYKEKLVKECNNFVHQTIRDNDVALHSYLYDQILPGFNELVNKVPTFDIFANQMKTVREKIEKQLLCTFSKSDVENFCKTAWCNMMWDNTVRWTQQFAAQQDVRVKDQYAEIQLQKKTISELELKINNDSRDRKDEEAKQKQALDLLVQRADAEKLVMETKLSESIAKIDEENKKVLGQFTEEKEELKRHNTILSETVQKMESTLMKQIDEDNQTISKWEGLYNEAVQNNEKSKRQCEQLEQSLIEKSSECSALKSDLAIQTQSKAQHNHLQREYDSLHEQYTNLQSEKEDLEQRQLVDLEQLRQQCLNSMEESRRIASMERDQLKQQLTSKSDECESLQSQLKHYKETAQDTQTKLMMKDQSLQELKTTWVTTQAQYNADLGNAIKSREAERVEYESKLSEMRKELLVSVKEKHNIESNIAQTRYEQQVEFANRIKAAESLKQSFEMKCTDLERRFYEQEKALKQSEVENRNSKSVADKANLELDWMIKTEKQQSASLLEAKSRNAHLEQRLKECQRDNRKELIQMSFPLSSSSSSAMQVGGGGGVVGQGSGGFGTNFQYQPSPSTLSGTPPVTTNFDPNYMF